MSWWMQALCSPENRPDWASADLWTEPPRTHGWGTGQQKFAIAICKQCPVRERCLLEALQTEHTDQLRWGVWGGLTPAERSRIAKWRAAA